MRGCIYRRWAVPNPESFSFEIPRATIGRLAVICMALAWRTIVLKHAYQGLICQTDWYP